MGLTFAWTQHFCIYVDWCLKLIDYVTNNYYKKNNIVHSLKNFRPKGYEFLFLLYKMNMKKKYNFNQKPIINLLFIRYNMFYIFSENIQMYIV